MTARATRESRSAAALLRPRPRNPSPLDALHFALAAPLLTYVWRIQDLIPGIAILKIPTLATLAAVMVLFLDPRVGPRLAIVRRHPIGRLMPWFILIAGISVVGSILPSLSVDFFLRSFVPAVLLALVVPVAITRPEDGNRFAALQIFGATLYCITVLTRFEVDKYGRLGSLVFYDSNEIGMLLVCTLPLCAYFVRHARSPVGRILALATVLLFLVTIARTGSRGAFLGLVVVGLYLLIFFRSARLVTRFSLVAGTTLVLLFGAGEKYREMMSTILHPTTDYNWVGRGDGGRMSIWARGIGYAKEHPLTGVGIWAFPIAEGTISSIAARQEYSKGVKWSAAHNSLIQVLAELGFAGFAVFVAILYTGWRTAARLARDIRRGAAALQPAAELANAHAAAIVGYVVSGFFLSQAYAPYLFFVLGMILGLDLTTRAAVPREAVRKAAPSNGAWGWRSRPPRVRVTSAPPPEAGPARP